jgi:hypothetical protein
MPLDNRYSTSAPSPPLSAVTNQMEQTISEHESSLDQLRGVILTLEQRLAYFLHEVPPGGKETPVSPTSATPIIAFIESSSREMGQMSDRLHSLLHRLPT